MAIVTVDFANAVPASDMLGGGYLEYCGRMIDSLWAEALLNRRVADWIGTEPAFWRRAGRINPCRIERTDFGARILCEQDMGGASGIAQDGIALKAGARLTGEVWLRASGGARDVRIALGHEYTATFLPVSSVSVRPGADWARFAFDFLPTHDDDNATFAITFSGAGALDVKGASLMLADNIDGWRSDAVAALKALNPRVIRYPGGTYADWGHWEDTVGPRAERKALTSFWNFIVYSKGDWRMTDMQEKTEDDMPKPNDRLIEQNDAGFDEFMRLCELLGAEPLITVNLGTGTATEAARWVAYANGGQDTEMGRLRARNGHPEPYKIRLWEIGNEMNLSCIADIGGLDGYVQAARTFISEMRAVDPTIQIAADAAYHGDAQGWNRGILERLGDVIDYIDIHIYTPFGAKETDMPLADLLRLGLSKFDEGERYFTETESDLRELGLAGRVGIMMGECGLSAGSFGAFRMLLVSQGEALYVSKMRNALLRHVGSVAFATCAVLGDGFGSGVCWMNASSLVRQPHYWAGLLYAKHAHPLSPRVSVQGMGAEDAAATYDPDTGEWSLFLVNADALPREIEVRGLPDGTVRRETLAAPLDTVNDFIAPDRAAIAEDACGAPGRAILPPDSLTVFSGVFA